MRILHLADVHLGASFAGFGALARRRAAMLEARLRALPEVVEAEDVLAVLIAGDLFDGPHPAAELRSTVREVFGGLREGGVPVLIVPGHYDPAWIPGSVYRDDLGAHVFGEPSFGTPFHVDTADGSLYVYGAGYDPARVPDLLDTYKRTDAAGAHVVLLHGRFGEVDPRAAAPYALDLKPKALARIEADYVALGGDHRFRPPDALNGLPACYPGSFAATNPSETGVRGAVIVELTPDRPPDIRRISSGVPEVQDLGEIDVSDMADEASIAGCLTESLSPHAIPRVSLVGSPGFPLDSAEVERLLARSTGYAEVDDHTWFSEAEHLDELAERDTIVGHAIRLGRERVRAADSEEERLSAEEALRIATRALIGAR